MEIEHIQKSRLYRESYLPGGVMRLRNQANAKVVGTRNYDIALDDIDREQLIDSAKRFISNWEIAGGAVDEGLREALNTGRPVVQSPCEVFLSPYPLILCCSVCKVIDFYDPTLKDERQISAVVRRIKGPKNRPYVSCKRSTCSGRMHQLSYVAVHRCGHIDTITIPFGARRTVNVGFNEGGGAFFYNSFFDIDTGERLAMALQDDCPNCLRQYPTFQETNKRGTPITSGESFYSQAVQYIALSKKVGGLVSLLQTQVSSTRGQLTGLTCDIAEGIASSLLGLTESTGLEKQLRALLEADAPSDDILNAHKAELEKKLKLQAKFSLLAETDEEIAELLDGTNRRIAELKQLLEQASGRFSGIRNILADDSTLTAIVCQRRSMEAVMLRHDVQLVSLQDSVSATADPVGREEKAQQVILLNERYGIASIAHIPDLLVVLSTIGFTRERRLPGIEVNIPPVRLNGFEDLHDSSLRGKYLLYAMSAKTEALLIRLDPCKVLQWCISAAGWEHPGEDILRNPQASHAHLLIHSPALSLSPGDVAKETKGRPPRECAPFHLLHSICHSLMGTARRHTGYDSNSLMEYLLPSDLSFLVYVTSVQNYTAGGLLSLFNHYLKLWFDDASLYAFNCAFDPICSDNGGACSGCLQTVIGCETFNHGLSRAYIHGGNVDREQSLIIASGFWDARL